MKPREGSGFAGYSDDRFGTASLVWPLTAVRRLLPVAIPVSGHSSERLLWSAATGWRRPISGIGGLELVAPKRPVGSVPGPPKEAPQQWAHTGRRHKGRLRRQVQGLQAAASRSGAQS